MPKRGGSKGRSKDTIRDLSKIHPTSEEHETILREIWFEGASPIVVAVLGASLAEAQLEHALRYRFGRRDDQTWERLTRDGAALNTLSQKIEVAYALKIINDSVRNELNTIRTIRNAFAHTKRIITFDHPVIAAATKTLKLYTRDRDYKAYVRGAPKPPPAQESYVSACAYLILKLMIRETRLTKAQTRRLQKKHEVLKRKLYAAAAAKLLREFVK